MKNKLLTLQETIALIKEQKLLVIAGVDKLLSQLPTGNWIGGSAHYLQGDVLYPRSENYLYVAEFGDIAENYKFKIYEKDNISNITTDAYDNGIIITIIPANTEVFREFSVKSPGFKNQFMNPLLGWISGIKYEEYGYLEPTCYLRDKRLTNSAVCLHVQLPNNKTPHLEIINAYEAIPDSDVVMFEEDGFDNKFCFVNGEKHDFYDYIDKKNMKYPQLIADYSGAEINVAVVKKDESKKILLGAPVFKDIEYRFARKKTKNYKTFFSDKLKNSNNVKYSYSCLYNFFNFELNKTEFETPGVYTFGEIAYQLLNVTFVYLVIDTLN